MAYGRIAETVFLQILVAEAAFCDDLAPPEWLRESPNATVQAWEFLSEGIGQAVAPDGAIATQNPGVPAAQADLGLTWMEQFDDAGPGGYVGSDSFASNLLLRIPNVNDERPAKFIRVQISGVWPEWNVRATPTVEALYGSLGPHLEAPEFPGKRLRSTEAVPGRHRWEDWLIEPNPFGEGIALLLPEGTFIDEVIVDTITTSMTRTPGDADGDGQVDDYDLSLLLCHWDRPNVDWSKGDFDGNGDVNDGDLSLLLTNWTGPSSIGIPEPVTMTVLPMGVLVSVLRHRRRTAAPGRNDR